MSRPMTPDRIWQHVREAAAQIGWHDREAVLTRAHDSLKGAATREQLERLWDERAEVMGAN